MFTRCSRDSTQGIRRGWARALEQHHASAALGSEELVSMRYNFGCIRDTIFMVVFATTYGIPSIFRIKIRNLW